MIGAFLNALGILLGALLGLTGRGRWPARRQGRIKSALGAFTAFCGLQLVWLNVSGSFRSVLKQFFLAVLAVLLGNLLGKILGLQKISNRLGRHATKLLAAGEASPARPANGLIAATILFCAAPLGLLGAVTDGLAMTSFVKMFRWPVALAALPVFFFFNVLTLTVHAFAQPWLEAHNLIHAVNAAAGLVICATALVVLEVRRVELANYLPALVVAPFLTWLLT
ncbi:MAG TPA: DUF554 family protein [Verrucomicrobiae bacterium]